MKAPAVRRFREKLAVNEVCLGLWVTLESASITEMAVGLGLDWVAIDVEHGHLDYREILDHVRATVRSDTVVLVRILSCDQGIIKRVLDIGADGILVPWVESAEELRQAVSYATYPLTGVRGIGGERATCWGQCLPQHVSEANENVLVVPIIESVEGIKNLPQMLNVPGVDTYFFGPSDYSSSAGYAGAWEGPGVAETILNAQKRIRAKGKNTGLIATGISNMHQRIEEGFRMIAVGLDGGLMIRSLRRALSELGRDVQLSTTLDPEDAKPVGSPAAAAATSADNMAFAPNISYQPCVNDSIVATGVVTMGGDAVQPMHTIDAGQCWMLVQGSAIIEVEGRMYTLSACDALKVPGNVAHSVMNRSTSEPAVFHLTTTGPRRARQAVDRFFPKRAITTPTADFPEQLIKVSI